MEKKWVECPRCSGTGEVPAGTLNMELIYKYGPTMNCDKCHGSGSIEDTSPKEQIKTSKKA